MAPHTHIRYFVSFAGRACVRFTTRARFGCIVTTGPAGDYAELRREHVRLISQA